MKMLLREKFDQLTLLELFWSEPIKADSEDGYWCYEAKDLTGTIFLFGIDTIHESVQIDLKNSDHSILTFTFELVDSLEIIDLEQGIFTFIVASNISEIQTKIQINLRPNIKINGYTLKR